MKKSAVKAVLLLPLRVTSLTGLGENEQKEAVPFSSLKPFYFHLKKRAGLLKMIFQKVEKMIPVQIETKTYISDFRSGSGAQGWTSHLPSIPRASG